MMSIYHHLTHSFVVLQFVQTINELDISHVIYRSHFYRGDWKISVSLTGLLNGTWSNPMERIRARSDFVHDMKKQCMVFMEWRTPEFYVGCNFISDTVMSQA
jgi:hypothetical protein